MIGSFKDDDAQRIFDRQPSRRYGSLSGVILRKLVQLNAAIQVDELNSPPGNRLELLSGDRIGQHSIRVNLQFRICFTWKDGYAYNVEIVDYH